MQIQKIQDIYQSPPHGCYYRTDPNKDNFSATIFCLLSTALS